MATWRQDLDFHAEPFESRNRREVPEWNRDECFGCGANQASSQIEFNSRLERNIQEQHGPSTKCINGVRRRLEQRRTIRRFGKAELLVELFEEEREIGSPQGQRTKAFSADTCEREFVKGARERSRKSGRACHRLEVREPFPAACLEHRTRSHCFSAQPRCGSDAPRGQHRRGESGRQLRETESMQANRTAAFDGDGSREIVGRSTRR
jgi:hypothetical protein